MFEINSRPKWDGGLYEGDEQARLETLNLAKELGAEYVDYELKVLLYNMYRISTLFVPVLNLLLRF